MEYVVQAAESAESSLIDITGGAPELNPNFRRFVVTLRDRGFVVQARTNLTVFFEPGMEDIPEFYRENEIRLVASLPCYMEDNVNAQRGAHAYRKSIKALKLLNQLGYGVEKGCMLDLVYNPGGPFLPPEQSALENDYRRELFENYGVSFTNLLTIANMPLGRFRDVLKEENKEVEYMQLLNNSFNPMTLDSLMCRNQISVGWNGLLYDCDFNLAIQTPVEKEAPAHIRNFNLEKLRNRKIVTSDHCFGCTAGCGSSCAGALV